MRATLRSGLGAVGLVFASSALALVVPAVVPTVVPWGAAWAQGKGDDAPAGKQIPLTQKIIDNLINAQKQVRAADTAQQAGKAPPDPKATDAKLTGILKSNGFASMSEFADASYSIGMVLSGMDESGAYVGTQVALQKQIDEVKADKKMPPNEKKEALDELNAAMKSAGTEKPLPGNIDLVKANAAKLSEIMQQGD